MVRGLNRIQRFARRLSGDRRGAMAIEFALISGPLMLLMFGVIELALILLVSVTLETATEFTARDIRTGVFQMSGSNTQAEFKGKVCRNMNWLMGLCDSNLAVDAQTFSSFSGAGGATEIDPANFDAGNTCWSVGNPGDIVLIRTYFKWPIITPLLKPIFSDDGHGGKLITTAKVFRNEPFNPLLTPVGNKCS